MTISNIYNLTKVFLKGSLSQFSNTFKNKIGKFLLYSFLFVYLIGVFSYLSYNIINILKTINQTKTFLGIVLMSNFAMILFTSLITSLNMYYFSNDNIHILPLPIKPYEILASKFNTMLVYEYLEEFLLFFSPLVVYGVLTSQRIVYYLLVIIVLIFFPIVPLVISSLIIVLISRFTSFIKNKNLSQIITTILSIIVSLSISMFFSRNQTDEDVSIMLMRADGLLKQYKNFFPTVGFSIDTLVKYDAISLMLLIIVSIAFYVLFIILGKDIFYKSFVGSLFSSSGISNKKINEKSAYNSKGLLFSYVLKEFKTYIRKPAYLMQLVFPIIIPIIMVFAFYQGAASQGDDVVLLMSELFYDDQIRSYVFGGFLLVLFLNSIYLFTSCVAISKDGKDAFFMKYIPVEFYKQIIYKMIPDVVLNMLMYLVAIITIYALFRIPYYLILSSLPVFFLYSIVHSMFILFDLSKPKLEWNNEMQVVKNNFRLFFAMIPEFINMALVVFLTFIMKYNMYFIMAVLSVLYIVIIIIFYMYISDRNYKLAKNIK